MFLDKQIEILLTDTGKGILKLHFYSADW